jgi:hypothetical protein
VVCKPNSLLCQLINIWGLDYLLSIAAKITDAEVIGHDEDYIGFRGLPGR